MRRKTPSCARPAVHGGEHRVRARAPGSSCQERAPSRAPASSCPAPLSPCLVGWPLDESSPEAPPRVLPAAPPVAPARRFAAHDQPRRGAIPGSVLASRRCGITRSRSPLTRPVRRVRAPPGHRLLGRAPWIRLACLHVHCSWPLVAGLGLVGDLGAFGKRAKAVADDRALMDKEVLRAVIGSDEAEALFVAEPLTVP